MSDYNNCTGYRLLDQKLKSHEAMEEQKDVEQETIIMSINNRMDKLEKKLDDITASIPEIIQKVINDLFNAWAGKAFKWLIGITVVAVAFVIKDNVIQFLQGLF